jgi:hypothetical protein
MEFFFFQFSTFFTLFFLIFKVLFEQLLMVGFNYLQKTKKNDEQSILYCLPSLKAYTTGFGNRLCFSQWNKTRNRKINRMRSSSSKNFLNEWVFFIVNSHQKGFSSIKLNPQVKFHIKFHILAKQRWLLGKWLTLWALQCFSA